MSQQPDSTQAPIRICISTCLLGEKVRFDNGHKKGKVTRKEHANVLSHLQGRLKKELDAADKAELMGCIESYCRGLVPLMVPLTLLRHHFRRRPAPWVAEQTYLHPYPGGLMLRNHV